MKLLDDRQKQSVLAFLADGFSVKAWCDKFGKVTVPPIRPQHVYTTLREDPNFKREFDDAERDGADALMDKARELADVLSNPKIGLTVKSADAKISIDIWKWLAARLNPEKYGEKLKVDSTLDATMSFQDYFAQQAQLYAAKKERRALLNVTPKPKQIEDTEKPLSDRKASKNASGA